MQDVRYTVTPEIEDVRDTVTPECRKYDILYRIAECRKYDIL